MLDFSTDFGKRAAARLAKEETIWLTTVGADGTPQPNPVWFLWEGAAFLIYTQPASHKTAHLSRNPRVALNFDGGQTDDVVVFTGAAVLNAPVPAESRAAYLDKYREGIARINMTVESFEASYSLALRVTPDRLRGF
jgi:PPOX class probable F420-dependent enzyme